MGKPLKTLLRRTLLSSEANLASIDDPFEVMPRLLDGHAVTGIIDGGASRGHIAQRLLRCFPRARAHLFEANPDFAGTLAALAAEDDRIDFELAALSDREGVLPLHVTEHTGQTSLFEPNERMLADPRGTPVARTVEVPAITLDDWAARTGNEPIQVIKLDIQAGEAAALRGARRLLDETVLLVYTEVFFNPMYEGGALYADVDTVLRRSGFSLYSFYRPRADERGMLKWADAVFVNLRKKKVESRK